jgi:hypothetical protein
MLELTLERAFRLAESRTALPDIWIERTERIGGSPSRTYVAALGTALLAKATDARVDSLAIKSKAGPNAYSMRGVVRVLVQHAHLYGYHLGVTKREPLNNQPWFGADRVDRFENVRADTQPFYRDLVRYLSDLNAQNSDEALLALAAFLRVRIAAGAVERVELAELRVRAGSDLGELVEIIQVFLSGDSEGGRLGQALVAAVFDLAFEEVRLASINDPTAIDVSVELKGVLILGIEVKQKPITESDGLGIAREVARRGADKALLVAIAPRQRRLDADRLRRQADSEHGVALEIINSLPDLLWRLALHSTLSARAFSEKLPERYLQRMREHEVPMEGLRHWINLCRVLPRLD